MSEELKNETTKETELMSKPLNSETPKKTNINLIFNIVLLIGGALA